MNISFNPKVNFCAGYGDPSRTMKKKYTDYNSINEEINKYTLANEKINEQINFLQQEIMFMVMAYQNLTDEDKEAVKTKMEIMKEKIEDLKDEIENNRAQSSALWYGYHERL